MDDKLEALIYAVKKFDYDTTTIVFMNPSDILELDMEDYSGCIYFISQIALERGTACVLKEDSEAKRCAYDFIKRYPDRVWNGEKHIAKLKELEGGNV